MPLMLLIVGTIRLPADKVQDARPAMARMILASRTEEGCEEYVYAEDMLDSGLIHVKELWRDRAALDRHFSSDHTVSWRSMWSELGIGNRDLNIYDVGEPRKT